MPVIDIHSTILSYDDSDVATTNPQRRFVDWTRHIGQVSVSKPNAREYSVLPGQELSIFNGTRATLIDGTTAFATSLNPVLPSTYRVTSTGGTAPGFRTDRVLALNGVALTVSINNNATAQLLAGAGTPFTAVQVGDTLFIPHTTTGDAALNSPFNPNNAGFWVVIAKTSTTLTLTRLAGEGFAGVAETVTPSSNAQVVAFSSAGVQVGDNLEISAGFSSVTQASYQVSQVTPSWIEFVSTMALPLETGILPTASGMTFYSDAKRFVYLEVDQEAAVRMNGDTGNSNRLAPFVTADPEKVAPFYKWGPVWDLRVVNRSATGTMTLTVISAQ